jgi:SulP family sulfate permease
MLPCNGTDASKDSSNKHDYQCSPLVPTPRVVEEQRRKRLKEEQEKKRKKTAMWKKRSNSKLRSQSSLQTVKSISSSPSIHTAAEIPMQICYSRQDNEGYPNYDKKEPYAISALYGLINVTIILPVLISFGTIIYKDRAFEEYLPVLIKLTILSGAVHQISFTVFSSLPFAIGQVQDAGLLFLSAMAGTIVTYCQSKYNNISDYDYSNNQQSALVDERILATATILLPLCTASLGVGLILIGQANLASYVQLLPTPVVGGYLAFIGFFCGQSGLALMANVQVKGIVEWTKFLQPFAFVHLLPGLVLGLIIYILVKRIRHMSVLPICIASLIGMFYLGLYLTSTTLQEARQRGWVLQNNHPPPIWYHSWEYLRFDKVEWGVIPQLLPTLVSMTVVVALSSSLDVAAIELELGQPLDYDHEIKTVGLGNVISGLTGGYTGSYIFSQSIFSLRAGIRRRCNGAVIAALEIITFMLPFSVLDYVPIFFFGSLLVMIATDLMCEWLWEARDKMTNSEFIVNVSTFCLIHVLGVEYGILAGLALYAICRRCGMDVGALDETEPSNVNPECSELLPAGSVDSASVVIVTQSSMDNGYESDEHFTHTTLMI